MTGTIPGSKLIFAMPRIGRTTSESAGAPYDGPRPSSNVTKDEFLLKDPQGQLLAHTVKEWDYGSETKFWTLTLRDDIKFPAYDRFADAEDMRWSIFEGHWTGFKAGGSTSAAFQTALPSVVDSQTLKIEFEGPTFGIAEKGLTVAEETTGLFPSREILALGNGDALEGWAAFMELEPGPVATGAYNYVRQVPAELNEFTVNVDWWHDPAPDFERLILLQAGEPATRLALAATEKADIINLSAPALKQSDIIDHLKVITNPNTVIVHWVFFNLWETGHPAYDGSSPFYDARVREAFNLAVDRDEINEVIYNGLSTRQDAPITAPAHLAWSHPIVKAMVNDPIAYDPARAKQLLVDANFDFGRTVKAGMWTRNDSVIPEWFELNEAFVNAWIKNLGIEITLERTADSPYSVLHGGESHAFDLFGGNRQGAGNPDLMGPSTFFGPGSVNFGPIWWDDISAMREKALAATDVNVFAQWNAEISKYLRDNWSTVPMFINPALYGVHKDRVESWPMTPGVTREHYIEHIRATEALRKAQ